MLKSIESVGKTVEEAIATGLAQLGLTQDEVEITVKDEPARGLFGLFGAKNAVVTLTEKDSPKKRAQRFLEGMAEQLGMRITMEIAEEDGIKIDVHGENIGVLIGHRGEALDALQYLTGLVANIGGEEYQRISLDIENYRNKREAALIQLAERMANRVQRSGRRLVMEPMSPNERWVFHTALQGNPYVITHSEGTEPNRRVVILPKRTNSEGDNGTRDSASGGRDQRRYNRPRG